MTAIQLSLTLAICRLVKLQCRLEVRQACIYQTFR